MRKDIDYRKYDPDGFQQDHPNDPIVAETRSRAEALAEQFRNADLSGTPVEQRREIDRSFDDLKSEQWDRNVATNHSEVIEAEDAHVTESGLAVWQVGYDAVNRARTRDDKRAAWEGYPQEIEAAKENAVNDPEYQDQKQQLQEFHGARLEAADREIDYVRQRFLEERGLDQVDLAAPENTPEKIEAPGASPSDAVREPEISTEPQYSAEQQSALAAWERARAPEPPTPPENTPQRESEREWDYGPSM